MLLEIELPVFHLTEEQIDVVDTGMSIDLEDCVLVEYTFYQIENIKSYSKGTCTIQSGGIPFLINMSKEKVKGLIREKRAPYFN